MDEDIRKKLLLEYKRQQAWGHVVIGIMVIVIMILLSL